MSLPREDLLREAEEEEAGPAGARSMEAEKELGQKMHRKGAGGVGPRVTMCICQERGFKTSAVEVATAKLSK